MSSCVSQTWCQSDVRTKSCADGPWTAVSSSHPGPDEIWLVQLPSESCISSPAISTPTQSSVRCWPASVTGGGWENSREQTTTTTTATKEMTENWLLCPFKIWLLWDLGSRPVGVVNILKEKFGIWSKTSRPEDFLQQHWRTDYLKWRFPLSSSQQEGVGSHTDLNLKYCSILKEGGVKKKKKLHPTAHRQDFNSYSRVPYENFAKAG